MPKFKKLMVLSVVIAILFTLANLVSGWTPVDPGYDLEYARSDNGVLPEYVEGNTPHEVDGNMVFKQDYGTGGFQLNSETDPVLFTFHPNPEDMEQVLRVWLAYHADDGKTYVHHWETEGIDLYYFMVKGGDGFLVYSYDGSVASDGHLISPRVGAEDRNIADISHIDIVFTPKQEETTSETSETETSITETETSETETETTGPSDETVTETSETETETTGPSDETVTETTETESETTEPSDETVTESSVTESLTDETIPLASTTDEEIPQTGETSGNGLVIGLVLLGLAAALTVVVYRSQKSKQ